jgi:hypothetical protein
MPPFHERLEDMSATLNRVAFRAEIEASLMRADQNIVGMRVVNTLGNLVGRCADGIDFVVEFITDDATAELDDQLDEQL